MRKASGILAFLNGIGLLFLSGYLFVEQKHDSFSWQIFLFIGGFALVGLNTLLFILKTFNRRFDSIEPDMLDSIIDFESDGKNRSYFGWFEKITGWTMLAGSAALLALLSYSVLMGFAFRMHHLRKDDLLILGFFLGAASSVVYGTRTFFWKN